VFTGGGVETVVRQHQALDRLASNDVRLDDFVDVSLGDVSISNGLGINHDVRAVFALVETARLVGANFALEAAFREFLLE